VIARAQPNLGHGAVAEILQAQSPFGHAGRTDRPDASPPADKHRAAVRGQPIRRGSEVDLPRTSRPEGSSSRRLPAPDEIAGTVERVQKAVPAADVPAKRSLRNPRDRIRQLDRSHRLARRRCQQPKLRRPSAHGRAQVVEPNRVPGSGRSLRGERGDLDLPTVVELERDRRSRLRARPWQRDDSVAAQENTMKHRPAHTHETLPAALLPDRKLIRRRATRFLPPSPLRPCPHPLRILVAGQMCERSPGPGRRFGSCARMSPFVGNATASSAGERRRGAFGKGYAVDRVWELLATALPASSYRAAAREGRDKSEIERLRRGLRSC
jgi:hypothetical protein